MAKRQKVIRENTAWFQHECNVFKHLTDVVSDVKAAYHYSELGYDDQERFGIIPSIAAAIQIREMQWYMATGTVYSDQTLDNREMIGMDGAILTTDNRWRPVQVKRHTDVLGPNCLGTFFTYVTAWHQRVKEALSPLLLTTKGI